MKATLEFNLPEDQDSFDKASKGVIWADLVNEILTKFRSDLKHNPDHSPEEVLEYAEKFRDFVIEEMHENALVI